MTRRRPPRWWRVGIGAVTILVVVVCLVTAWTAIAGSNPAYLITLNLVALGSAALVVWGLVTRLGTAPAVPASPDGIPDGTPSGPARVVPVRADDAAVVPSAGAGERGVEVEEIGSERAPTAPSRPAVVTFLGRGTAVAAAVVLLAALLWLRPYAAEPVAIAAMSDGRGVTVDVSPSRIELRPGAAPRRTGLVFYPGALVDPRAYAAMLRPLAEAGYPVVIVKAPYDIAFFAPDAPSGVIADEPDTTRWVVGGHSLGGVVASSYAGAGHPGVAGLLLWASFPASSIAGATALQVTSISGTQDGLSTPAKIDAARPLLPPATEYVVIEGANHADFGDYGPQSGDGVATIERAEAQAQIEQASLALLDRVDRQD